MAARPETRLCDNESDGVSAPHALVTRGGAHHGLAQELILVLEIAEEGDFIDLRHARDLAGGGAGDAVPSKNTEGGIEDSLTGLFHASTYLHINGGRQGGF